MDVLFPRCAGLDVHKKVVVACVRIIEQGKVHCTVRRRCRPETRGARISAVLMA